MNLAIVADNSLEKVFDSIKDHPSYKNVNIGEYDCAFLPIKNGFNKNMTIIKQLGITHVLEIADEFYDNESLAKEYGVKYTGFFVKGTYKSQYLRKMINMVLDDINTYRETTLTPREKEVLLLVSKGMQNKDIAKALFLSEKTVKNHISNIFRKINVSDRTKAALFAIKNLN